MINDPIVEDIQKYRKEHAVKHGNDLHRIVEAFREAERASTRPVVNFGPRFLSKAKHVEQVVDGSVNTRLSKFTDFVVIMKCYTDKSRRLITSFYVDKEYTRKNFEKKYEKRIG